MKFSALLFLFCISAATFVSGQDPVKTLTFKEAVKIGLEKNLALNQQENLLIASQVNKTAGLFRMAPSVNITGNAGRNDGNSFNQQQGQVVNGVIDFFGANANANMPLFNGFNNFNAHRQASNQYEAQLQLVKRTNQDVIRNVANQYLICLLDKELHEIQIQNVETQQQQYEQIKEQVAAGSRAEVDLINQEYQVKNAELLAMRSASTLRNDLATLSQTLQLDPLTHLEIQEPGWDVNLEDGEVKSIDETSATALEQRSDLAQARFIEKASQFGYQSSKGTLFPKVGLFAQYGSQYNYIQSATNRSFEQQFRDDNTQLTYGLSFTIPILGAFQNRNTTVANRVAYENSKLQTENTEILVKSDVIRAHQNYRDARSSYDAASAQLKAAQLSQELEQERYRLGISDIVALTLANQNHIRAQGDFVSARYTLMFQKLLISYAEGTLNFEDIP
ncbi:MAG: TolC family protein [Cyclobacteriaceae bacterium]|nr:TolC family protein [Cyclobacteriaceae bacterium]